MLTAYLAEFNALIQAPSSPVALIDPTTATGYINTARNQVAAEGECIREIGNLTLAAGTSVYPLSAVTSVDTTLSHAIALRMAWLNGAPLEVRSWEWFGSYYYGPGGSGTPRRLAQQGQGSSATIYFNPVPPALPPPAPPSTVLCDCAWLPISLVNDSTAEAIPYPWTDAVPFYAAWLGLQSVQRQADADMVMQRYVELMRRARSESVPSVLPENLPGDAGAKLAASKTSLTQPQGQAAVVVPPVAARMSGAGAMLRTR
jgi:hypothetical protein